MESEHLPLSNDKARQKHRWTVEEFNQLEKQGKPRVSLGDGLYVITDKKGNRSFQYRTYLQGKDNVVPLGDVSNTTFESAREKSDQFHITNRQVKQKRASEKFNKKIMSLNATTSNVQGILTLDELRKFVAKLNEKIGNYFPRGTSGQGRNYVGSEEVKVEAETYLAIYLALMTALQPKEVISFEIEDIGLANTAEMWEQKVGLVCKKTMLRRFLPSHVRQVTTQLINMNALHAPQGKLFPYLSKLNKPQQKEVLTKKIEELCGSRDIKPNDFPAIFIHHSIENSCYNSDFIRTCTKKELLLTKWKNLNKEEANLWEWWNSEIHSYKWGSI